MFNSENTFTAREIVTVVISKNISTATPKIFEQARVCLDEAVTERSCSKINLA